ncbi:probable calcium-binding protein CML48 isoform X2 [Vigna radiata var. radiata]|uniref:Probable calcium-binding protein CML48 isoform X2 n=1 Tax=Vigna radiata var. radiata TaxID=3916 RepID=A0A1S3W118_VIGRR|nr:probable calcium-binding protein CML48 isoform X2 [Vigna radiata var. radiata]
MSSSYGGYRPQSQYAPSAPQQPPYSSYYQTSTSNVPPPSNSPSNYSYSNVSPSGYPSFPPGTPQDVITSFQMVDRDRSGFIDEHELQQALSSGFHRFNLRTIRLLIFLFKNPQQPLAVGPKEFAALWSCLGQWRGIFERYDKDRSGKIDPLELRDALYGIGYAVPGSVLQLLLSKYGDGSGRRVELCFDNFVECGMIIKGLTDKFKEKDTRYTGSATLSYDDFMTMVLPFLVSYN